MYDFFVSHLSAFGLCFAFLSVFLPLPWTMRLLVFLGSASLVARYFVNISDDLSISMFLVLALIFAITVAPVLRKR